MPIEWTQPFLLTSPQGTLRLNEDIGSAGAGIFLLDEQKCSAAPALRVVVDDLPQTDGSELHRSKKTGYTARLGIWIAQDNEVAACGTLLRELWDLLMLHVNALVDPSEEAIATGQTRLQWTPSGYGDDRMYDRIKLIEWPAVTYEGGGLVSIVMGFQTPLPYAIDLTQRTQTLDVTVTNPGTARYAPVFKVHGPVSTFTIINETTGQEIGYDAGLPGASGIDSGHYAEISTFDNTITLDGDVAFLDAGVDINESEYFGLDPGPNVLSFTGDGGSCDILWNPAWAD